MKPGRRRRVDNIPEEQAAIAGVNIRTLRQRKGWSQAKLGELMGWQNASTVCAAEGRRDGRQRGFTTREIERLAAIFDISPRQLTTQCTNCNGQPPAGFACLACGAALGGDGPPTGRDRDCGRIGHTRSVLNVTQAPSVVSAAAQCHGV